MPHILLCALCLNDATEAVLDHVLWLARSQIFKRLTWEEGRVSVTYGFSIQKQSS